jgi:hypothetical protein
VTRMDAAAFVEALDDYLDACMTSLSMSTEGAYLAANAARERFIDRLSGDEGTQPLAGSAK